MTNKQIIDVCDAVAHDIEQDAKNLDGMPFNGKTVAEYFGYYGAAIQALARMVKVLAAREVKS